MTFAETLDELINTTIPIALNMIPMRNINQISKNDRLFYELRFKKNMMDIDIVGNWVSSGRFKEVINIENWIKHDERNADIAYLEHHNFMLIKEIELL